jgi:CheY-like chemotaxis protein
MISSADSSDIEKCRALGVNNYIVKPVTVDAYIKITIDLGL